MKKDGRLRRWGEEFKTFAMRGNVIDLAVGVIIGTAFGKITASLVDKVVMPVLGIIIGGINFSDLNVTVPSLHEGLEPVSIYFGDFIGAVIDFILIAIVVFILVKAINKLRSIGKHEDAPAEEAVEDAAPVLTPDQILLTEIRDLLKERPDKSDI